MFTKFCMLYFIRSIDDQPMEDDSPEEYEVGYKLIEKGTVRAKPKLVDNRGFSYIIKVYIRFIRL